MQSAWHKLIHWNKEHKNIIESFYLLLGIVTSIEIGNGCVRATNASIQVIDAIWFTQVIEFIFFSQLIVQF